MTATLQFTKQKCRGSLSSTSTQLACGSKRVMGLEPTISCLGSKRSTTELHPRITLLFQIRFWDRQEFFLLCVKQFYRLHKERQGIVIAVLEARADLRSR